MKKLLFIIMLLPIMAWSQDFDKYMILKGANIFIEWNKYINDCNELIQDTVVQSGIVKCELVPVKMNGKIVSYNTAPIDTVWQNIDCREYKYYEYNIFRGSSLHWISPYNLTTSNNYVLLESVSAKNTFSIIRNKICQVKKRKATFEDFFMRWCVEKKLIELN